MVYIVVARCPFGRTSKQISNATVLTRVSFFLEMRPKLSQTVIDEWMFPYLWSADDLTSNQVSDPKANTMFRTRPSDWEDKTRIIKITLRSFGVFPFPG